MPPALRSALPAALLIAVACDGGFDPQYHVDDLRILAVSAQVEGTPVADATPDGALQLRALIANPLARAPLAVRWFLCEPAAQAVPPCLDAEYLKDPLSLAGAPGVREIASGATPAPVPMLPLRPATLDAIRLALEDPARACRLFVEVPIVVVAEAEARREVAVKIVRVVPAPADLAPYPQLAGAYRPNENPRTVNALVAPAPGPEEVCGTATPLGTLPLGRAMLCARTSAPNSYETCGPAGERESAQEAYSFQWYATGGEFPGFEGKGNATGYRVEIERPAEAFTLWLIVRDGRGGEAWVEHRLGPP